MTLQLLTQRTKKSTLLSLCLWLWAGVALAQTGTVKGTIQTSDGKPAAYVNVTLAGIGKGNATDAAGVYEIRKVPVGTHQLQASLVGFSPVVLTVDVKNGETTVANVVLNESSDQLDEVQITARRDGYKVDKTSSTLRLQTPLIETPQNIQVVSRQLLADQQAFDMLENVSRNVSGVQRYEHWDNYALIHMRGAQVTAFRNGMNVAMPFGPLAEDMSMVERIEFVKGPAGFMVSNGEPSGLYNVVTKKPTGINKGEASMVLGSFQTLRTALDLDGKLSKNGKLLYRLNVMGQTKGSHRKFEYNDRYSIVPVLKYQINDQTSVTVEYTHQFSKMGVIGSNYAFSGQGYADLPIDFTTAEANLDPTRIHDNSVMVNLQHQINDRWKFNGQLAYFHFKQIGQSLWPWSVAANGDMQRGLSIWDALGKGRMGQFFVTGTETTGAIEHNILAGLDIVDKDTYADWNQGAAFGGTFNIYKPVYGTVATADLPVWDRSKSIEERGVHYNQAYTALYLQDQLGFWNNRVRLTVAGRYTSAQDIDPYSGNTDKNKLTPRLGLSASLAPNMSVYAVYDKTFLPNAGVDYQGNTFDPVMGTNHEIGFKRDWMDGRWNTTVAAYKIIKSNVLVTDTEHPDPNTGQYVFSKQVGETTSKGIELDVRGELVRNLELVLNYALTDARVTKDTESKNLGRISGASRHINNAWLNYRFSQGTLQGVRLSLGYQWQVDRTSWYVFDGSVQELPNYFRLDGAIGWSNQNFNVGLNVNNLLDDYLFSGSPYINYYNWQTEPRMNFRLNVGYKF